MEILSCIWIEKEMCARNLEQNFPIVKSKEGVSRRRKLKAKEFANSSNSNQEPLGDLFLSPCIFSIYYVFGVIITLY